MDYITCTRTFVEVAQSQSFTKAARRLGMSRASATKHVAALEAVHQARFLTRNSQFVSLTEAGEVMLEGGLRLLNEVELLSDRVQAVTSELTGSICVGVPPAFGAHYLTPAVAAFQSEFGDVSFELQFDDGTSNLVRKGQDVCIRVSESLHSTEEIAKLIMLAPQVLVAAPSYLASAPPLTKPEDLTEHHCLINKLKTPNSVWTFEREEETYQVAVTGPVSSNFGSPLLTAALQGDGLTIHPHYMVREYLSEGRLEIALPDFTPTQLRVHAVYPQRDFMPARIRAFLDFLKDWVAKHRPDDI